MGEEPILITVTEKKKSPLKILLITFVSIMVLFSVVTFYFSYYYTYNTIIAGEDRGFASKAKVLEEYSNGSINIPIVFTGRHDGEAIILLSDFKNKTEYDLSRLDRPSNFKGLKWIPDTINGRNIDVYADITIEEESFIEALHNSIMYAPKLAKEPENAYLGGYDSKKKEFVIEAGDPGNMLNDNSVVQAVETALRGISADTKEIRIDLIENDCYKKALVSTENAGLIAEKNKADKMLASKIIYDWNGVRVSVDADIIKDWIKIENNKAVLDNEKISEFVEKTANQNDTFGKPMEFTTTLGKKITIQRGDYGWKTNIENETAALIEHIKNSDQISKEPEYEYKGYAKGQNDVGKSYVEVDLSNQHVYLYLNGKMTFETDCVSGCISQGHKTPGGIYGITYKTTNATLRGPGYASFVYYWMPYCGGVGLHDATWRDKFGGEIYKNSGSHGCVNLPKNAAKQIYESVEKNFPVVSYW